MRVLTSMLYCLLALLGCDGKTSTTTVTRSQLNGEDTLFSRTTQERDAATFQCLRSSSGRCHYQVFEEKCPSELESDKSKCVRTAMDSFSLAVGDTRLVKGLAGHVRECVQAQTPGPGTRCSG